MFLIIPKISDDLPFYNRDLLIDIGLTFEEIYVNYIFTKSHDINDVDDAEYWIYRFLDEYYYRVLDIYEESTYNEEPVEFKKLDEIFQGVYDITDMVREMAELLSHKGDLVRVPRIEFFSPTDYAYIETVGNGVIYKLSERIALQFSGV